MAWLYLILAGLCEVGWPLGFKLANLNPRYHLLFLVLAVVSMGMSGWLLYIAQKTIPMGTAYMIWTGIGGVGTVRTTNYIYINPLVTIVTAALCIGERITPAALAGAALILYGMWRAERA